MPKPTVLDIPDLARRIVAHLKLRKQQGLTYEHNPCTGARLAEVISSALSSERGEKVGCNDAQVRQIIGYARSMSGLRESIASNSQGYWYADGYDELEAYRRSIASRIAEMQDHLKGAHFRFTNAKQTEMFRP